jgi:hypothetical protein
MSYLSALAVVPDRRPSGLAEFRNAHGWHPSIWDRLCRHHGLGSWFNDGPLKRLWRSINTLPDWQQVPLILTFDTGVIPMPAFGESADLLDEFERRLPSNPDWVNHVPAMAELLRSCPETPLFGVVSSHGNCFEVWPDEDEDDPVPVGIPLAKMAVLGRHREIVDAMFAGSEHP